MYFADYLTKKKQKYGKKFDGSDLAPNFIPFYESGQRIEVKTDIEGIKRGYVGITTGWKPSFLLVLKSNSTGSSILLTHKSTIIKTINKYR